MSGIRSIQVESVHDLFETNQQLHNDDAPTESDDISYNYPANTEVAEIREYYHNVVYSIMGAQLANIEVCYMETDDTQVWEVVENRHADGTPVRISDLATISIPDWYEIDDFQLFLRFQYVM